MDTEEAWVVNIPYERYYSPRPAVPIVVYAHSLPFCIPPIRRAISRFPMPCGSCAGDAAAILSDNSYHAVVTFVISLSMPRMQICMRGGILLCPPQKMSPCFFPIIMPILPFKTPIHCSVPTMCPPQSI